MLKNFKVKTLFKKADSFFKDKNYNESLKCYNEILLLDDSNLKALYRKSYILYKLKLYDEAIQILNTILDLKNCIDALLLLGRINLLENNYEKGMYYYKLSLNDDIFDSCKFVKEILFFGHYKFRYTCKDYKRFYSITVSLCDLYLEKDDTYETKLFKSHNLYKLGYYENALSIIDEFPESYLNNPQYNFLKSSILLNLSRYEDALLYSNKVLKNDSNGIDYLQIQKKGESLYYLEDFNGAIKCFNKLNDLNKFTTTFIFLSKISIKNEEFNDALKNIDKAIDLTMQDLNELKNDYSTIFIDRASCEAFYYKSLILFKLGRYGEALDLCNCLIDKVPDCTEAIELKNQIENLN